MSTLLLDETPPAGYTGNLRLSFQVEMCMLHPGQVLNVGCNEDPGGLHERFGDRIVNCDLEAFDTLEFRVRVRRGATRALACLHAAHVRRSRCSVQGDGRKYIATLRTDNWISLPVRAGAAASVHARAD